MVARVVVFVTASICTRCFHGRCSRHRLLHRTICMNHRSGFQPNLGLLHNGVQWRRGDVIAAGVATRRCDGGACISVRGQCHHRRRGIDDFSHHVPDLLWCGTQEERDAGAGSCSPPLPQMVLHGHGNTHKTGPTKAASWVDDNDNPRSTLGGNRTRVRVT